MPKIMNINTSEILQMYNDGKSFIQIGKDIGVSANTVMRRLQDIGIKSDKHKNFDKAELYDMYIIKGMTTYEIADIFKVSQNCINSHLRKNEIPLRESGHRIKLDSDIRALFSVYKYGAKHRNHEFSLSLNLFKELIKSNCHYCGNEPSQHYKNKCYDLVYNGIDRIDNSKGYLTNNVVSCCWNCNNAKGNLTHAEFIEQGIQRYNYYFSKFIK